MELHVIQRKCYFIGLTVCPYYLGDLSQLGDAKEIYQHNSPIGTTGLFCYYLSAVLEIQDLSLTLVSFLLEYDTMSLVNWLFTS